MRDGGADLRARIAAGLALGDLNALEVLSYERIDDEQGRLIAWRSLLARIPRGLYTFGSLDAPEALDDETRFEQELEAFDIGFYPVTNAEWGCFIAAGGYAEPRWWVGDAARAFFEGRGTNEGRAQTWIWWK
ncbi:MAG: formylglycine-generating enzyme family protein [Methylococcaceae bacterium]|nr:formylglycine-generating enzyme family protein [Methylococcaceae bacterium]